MGSSVLITTAQLARRLAGPVDRWQAPVVLDVRWRLNGPPGADSYRAGHLPGAVYLDVDKDLAGEPGAVGRHPLPDPDRLQRVLVRAGVRADRPVVAYDDADGSVAARAWWLLRWAGHSDVAVLDGGFAAWRAEGRPIDTAEPDPVPGDFQVQTGGMPVLDAAGALAMARDGVLLDARTPQRYTGETEPVDRKAGHIPGAVNAPFTEHTDAAGKWRQPAELEHHLAQRGVLPTTPVGAYCGSGVTAASVVLATAVAGFAEPAALYVGSWSNWSAADRPVATGQAPG